MDLQLGGKRALVLGASKGLGRAIAEALAAEGAEVITVARSGAVDITADLDDPAAPQAIIDAVRARGASPDILVLNAGGPPTGAAASTTPADFARVMDRMFNAQLTLAQAFLPAMRAGGVGNAVRHSMFVGLASIAKQLAGVGPVLLFDVGIVVFAVGS